MADSVNDGQYRNAAGQPASLSTREQQVLQMAAEGMTNAQIAASLSVTTHAVKFHLAGVYRKLGTRNRTEAAVAYLRRGPTPHDRGFAA
jgi:DNA-binding CsgD family transcriptional regulator